MLPTSMPRLKVQNADIKSKKAEKIGAVKNEAQLFFQFLETGVLSWNSNVSSMVHFEAFVLEQVSKSAVFRKQFVEKIRSAAIRKRLVNQFSLAVLYRIPGEIFCRAGVKKELAYFAEEAMSLTAHFTNEFKGTVPAEKKNRSAPV